MSTKSNITNKFILVWLFIILPTVAAIIFRKSFNLGLYGDDWQHLYILWKDFYVFHNKSFFDIHSYLNPYWPEYLYLGIINHFWGYYPPAYFIASFLSRLFANIALYFFSYELTKSKLAAVLATLIFLLSAAGLQTTDWVFNMNTYFGLGLLTIASTIYLKIRKLKTFMSWYYLFFIITFTLSLAVVPTRMNGAVPFIILTELFLTYIVERQKIKFDKYLIIRMLLAVGILFLLVHFKSFGEGSFATDRLASAAQVFQAYESQGFHAIWFYFFGILGHLVIPDFVNIDNFFLIIVSGGLFSVALGSFIVLSFFKPKNVHSFLPIIIFNCLWSLFLSWLVLINPNPYPSLNPYQPTQVLFSISLGGQFVFWSIWMYFLFRKTHLYLSATIIISLAWILTMTITYWLFTPNYIIETTGRYMTMGAAGFSIFLSTIFSLIFNAVLNKKSNLFNGNKFIARLTLQSFVLILLFWLFTNIYASQTYFGIHESLRNKDLTDRVWDTLTSTVPKLDPQAPSVFFFTGDNQFAIYEAITFGFFMRAGLIYQISDESKTPLYSTDYKELLSYVQDGSPLQKVHGRIAQPVPISRIFAFDFRNGQLTNITDLARKQLMIDLKIP